MKNSILYISSLLIATYAFAQNGNPSFTEQPVDVYAPQGTASFSINFSINSTAEPSVDFLSGNPTFDFSTSGGSSSESSIDNDWMYRWSYSRPQAEVGTTHQYQLRASSEFGDALSNPFRITMVSGLLNVSQDLGNGYFQNPTLGLIYAGSTPWLYQDQGLGWIAPDNDATAITAWLYSPLLGIGWLYYQAFQYPWMYSTDQNSWVYFVYENNARGFFVQRTGQWIFR